MENVARMDEMRNADNTLVRRAEDKRTRSGFEEIEGEGEK